MQPDRDASLRFLKKWREEGPWVLTAIDTDKKSIKTRTFHDLGLVSEWLEENHDRNIYFSVNPLIRDMSKKPSASDVSSMDWLHVDIDPRVGEDLKEEQDRIISLLSNPPGKIPQPTVIVFSGGGYQGFWRLSEGYSIDGNEARYEEAKRYNQAIEQAFGADSCHNVDRIMRLPGTVNWPDARKQKKGRKPALSTVIWWEEDNSYPLGRFAQAPVVQTGATGFVSSRTVKISGNVLRINDLSQLPETVSGLCKVVIAQGNDPDDPNRFPSRSEALFFVCCELVRAGVDDDTIFSIITDHEWLISSSVLEKGSSASSYAARQIERARENAVDPWLRKLNDKYAVVTIGGKVRVIYEEYDELLERHRLVKMTFEDFRNRYMNIRVEIGQDANGNPRFAPLGKWWLEQECRRQYERVVFAPRREVSSQSFNLWRGFSIEPKEGNGHEPLLEHIFENICNGVDDLFEYLMNWSARAVQQPWLPGEVAPVLRGNQGVGKGYFARAIGKLFGRHFVHVSSAHHLTGTFNAHLRDCAFLFADEAFYAGDKRHASVLKSLVTEPTIFVEPKGVDAETAPNCLHIVMASNEDWVVPAGVDERRFFVVDVSEKRIRDAAYFAKLTKSMKSGGEESLLHMLMNRDLEGFEPRVFPVTQALRDQKVLSYTTEEEWWYGKLVNGRLATEHEGWSGEVPVEQLNADYVNYTRAFNITRRGSATKLGHFLARAVPGKGP